MDVMPPFVELISLTGARLGRRLERATPPSWSEADWDRIITAHADLLAAALRSAGVIAENSELRFLGRQVDNIDLVFAEVSVGEGPRELRRLVLVEDKLVRNSEAKRTVLAQILEYSRVAQEDWPSANLVEKFSPQPSDRGWVEEHLADLKHLSRTGDFLLVIIGDGIDDRLAHLAKRFARHDDPLTLAELVLVSMPLYRLDEAYVLVPHVVSAVQRNEREMTIRVVVQDHVGRPVAADVIRAEPEGPRTGVAAVVRDEVVSFLRAVRGRVEELLPGVPGTKVPRKSLEFLQQAPDGASVTAKVHFGGYLKDVWSPIEVGLSVLATDTRARDEWVELFKERRNALPTGFKIRLGGPRTVDFLSTTSWENPTELAHLEGPVAEEFAKFVGVLKAVTASRAASDSDSAHT